MIMSITTDTRSPLRSCTAEVSNIEDVMKRARVEVIQFVKELVSDIKSRLGSDDIVNLMRETFENFSSTALAKLLTNAVTSGRDYGNFETLKKQLDILKKRYADVNAANTMAK